MAKKKKDIFDAAYQNKELYIQDNYLVKDDESPTKLPKHRQIAIVSMLSVLLVCIAFVFYWTYFGPQSRQSSLVIEATAAPQVTPEDTLALAEYEILPTPTPRPVLQKYSEYVDVYPDLVGWISIGNIKVDYPVVRSPDPSDQLKYLDKGPDESASVSGSIFLDFRNSIDASDRHTIVYGHNMKNGSMFGQLDLYLGRTFFSDHLIIRYDTLYEELEWEVFNVFETTTEFYYIETYFSTDEDFVNLMMQCVYKSYYRDNTTVITAEDRVLTLSTCTNDIADGRLVIQAKLITPLEAEETKVEEPAESADHEPEAP